MTINFTEAVLLHCLKQISDERTIYSLYHLFQGKKSSQTIQDAHLYRLTAYFRVFPFLTRKELEQIIVGLTDSGLLDEKDTEQYRLTGKGQFELEAFCTQYPLPPRYLDGWKYHQLTPVFWQRLSILVQVCSNLVHQKKAFIPIQNKQEILDWVKAFIKTQNRDRYDLANLLYSELTNCLQQVEGINPSVLVLRLTGHDKIGLTSKQAAEMLRLEFFKYHLEFMSTLHSIIDTVLGNRFQYPLLSGLVGDTEKPYLLTISTEKTYQLLNKGYSPEQISAIRKLKRNTIEDHIVEIALNVKEFELKNYVHPEKEARIVKATHEISVKKLTLIREQVKDANYFEIRLVLARNGDIQWN